MNCIDALPVIIIFIRTGNANVGVPYDEKKS